MLIRNGECLWVVPVELGTPFEYDFLASSLGKVAGELTPERYSKRTWLAPFPGHNAQAAEPLKEVEVVNLWQAN